MFPERGCANLNEAKFPNGNVFKVHVNPDGEQKANGTNVGSANDNSHGFSVYKDDGYVYLPL